MLAIYSEKKVKSEHKHGWQSIPQKKEKTWMTKIKMYKDILQLGLKIQDLKKKQIPLAFCVC